MDQPMIGKMVEADFPTDTITFKMIGQYEAAAGLYAIMPAAMVSELRGTLMALAMFADGSFDTLRIGEKSASDAVGELIAYLTIMSPEDMTEDRTNG